MARSPRVAQKRYLGGFTLVGLVFVILAGVALVLTIIALRWDGISSGSKYEAIGSIQSLVILLGLVVFVFCAVASVYDLLRGLKGGNDKASAPVAPDLP
jgi:NADH:ubiquinone oxidoreductase subunit H